MKKIPWLVTISLIALSMFSILAPQTKAQDDQGTWVSKADMPTPRSQMAAVTLEGKIYAIGGTVTSPGDTPTDIVEIYDPTTNSWSTGTPAPIPLCPARGVAVGSKIYVFSPDNNRTFCYDPTPDTWTEVAPIPCRLENGKSRLSGVGVVDGKIYVAKGDADLPYGEGWTYCYDPATDTWSGPLSPILYPHTFDNFVGLGGKLYAVGGWDPTQGARGETNRVDVYDTETDSWELDAIPRMSYHRGKPAASVMDGKIYAVGGWNGYTALSSVEAYDPTTNSWTNMAPMSIGRYHLATAVADGKLYAIGGDYGGAGGHLQSLNEEFTPPGWTPPPSKKLSVDAHGEIDYFPWEQVKVKVAALVSDTETMEPVSDADVSIKIYDPEDNLWIDDLMTEKLSLGIYVWESNETVRKIFWQGGKGVYVVLVEASYSGGPTASDILVFHIDPPAAENNQPPMIVKIAPPLVAIAAIAAIALVYFKKKRES